MTVRDDGGPAFPVTREQWDISFSGLTKHEYFAAAALSGIQQWDAIVNERKPAFIGPDGPEGIAATACAIADAMLAKIAERAK